MRTLALSTMLIAAPVAAARQDARADWLREHAVEVRTIDPADEDFADLEPLVALIGDSRIVHLGEQTHGDGATFLAKARLIRFLHQRLGFDVVIWESGYYDCRQADAAFDGGAPAAFAAAQGIFPIWARSREVLPTLEYMRGSRAGDRPIALAGFDCQFSGSAEGFGRDVIAFFAAVDPEIIDPGERRLLHRLAADLRARSGAVGEGTGPLLARLRGLARSGDERLLAAHPPAEIAAMARILDNALAYTEIRGALAGESNLDHPSPAGQAAFNLREEKMAETLVWLVRDVYPDRKVITWGASSHLMHGSRGVESRDAQGRWAPYQPWWVPMGDHVHAALGKEAYTIGFIAHAGTAGTVFSKPWPIEPAPRGSLDALCHEAGRPFMFIDLRSREPGHWLRQPIVARPRGYSEMRADWSLACDAFMFTGEMSPSTPLP